MNGNRARGIALAGVLAGLQLVFLSVGYFVDTMVLACNFLASLCIMVTMKRKMYKESILSYIAVSILAFVIMNISALPYVVFTGVYTLVICFMEDKNVPHLVSALFAVIWANGVFYLLYRVVDLVVFDFDSLGFYIPYYVFVIVVSLFAIGMNGIMLFFYKNIDKLVRKFFGKNV